MSHAKPSRAKRLFGALVAAAVAFGGAVVAPTQAFAAESGTVAGATLDWGIKDTFRSYLHGPIANGNSTLIGGVTMDDNIRTAGKGYHWTGGTGTAVNDGSSGDVRFTGGVQMVGHHGELDMTLTNPRIEITGATTGKMYLDVSSRRWGQPGVIAENGMYFGDLTLPAPAISGDTTLTYNGVTLNVTAKAAEAFGSVYNAGDKFEGMFNLTVPVTVAAPAAVATTTDVALRSTTFTTADPIGVAAGVTDANGVKLTDEHGTVEFFVDGTSAGQGRFIAAAGMFALNIPAQAVGAHNITAKFTPKDANAYAASESAAKQVTVNAPGNPTDPPTNPPANYTPVVKVFKADGTTELGDEKVYEGDTIVIKGTGFNTNNPGGRGAPVPANLPQGYYSAFGQFAEVWQPSNPASTGANRPAETTAWALTDAAFDGVPAMFKDNIAKGRVVLNADGSFTWTLKLPAIKNGVANGKAGIYTYPAGGLKDATHEVFVPLNFVAGDRPAEPQPPVVNPIAPVVTPAAPADECVAYSATSGSFNWGLRESFRTYVQGRIAKGSFSGGAFSVAGGAFNAKDGVGVINFSGAIHATGHKGVLNYNLTNPSIQLTGGNSGVMYATVNGTRVAYANLTFSGLVANEQGITANWVSATLTSAGAQTFSYNGSSFYQAGEALDGFSLNVTLGGKVACAEAPGTDPKEAKKLAATGADGAPLGAVSLLLLAGAVAAAAGRRFQKQAR